MKRKYRIKRKEAYDAELLYVWHYVVQVHHWFGWVDVKEFYDPADESYALRCAEELLDKLNVYPVIKFRLCGRIF